MPEFGLCNEPSCTETAVRLFDCTHHCMKLVCLQHLIEHDRLIEHNKQQVDNLRTELKQLWETYALLIDETKLRIEFEEKLKKHHELIDDITNLFQNDSINTEQYRIIFEKLKQKIDQEKESFTRVEHIKIEAIEEISTNGESDPLDVSLATRMKKLNNDIGQQKRKSLANDSSITNNYDHELNNTSFHSIENSDTEATINQTNTSVSLRNLSGNCPFWFDGAFGLTREFHGMYLCSHEKFHQRLFRHLIKSHKLTVSTVQIICQAIQNNEDPSLTTLFTSNDIVMDQINHFHCPFSIHNKTSSSIENSSERPCRIVKPQFAYTLRYHLMRIHQMSMANANKLVYKLKKAIQNN